MPCIQNLYSLIYVFFLQGDISSVHYLMVPSPVEKLIKPNIEASVSTLQSVVELGRYLRDKLNCPIKYPLPEVVVIHKDKIILDDVLLLENYIKEELNVKTVTTSTDKEKYGVALKAEINFKLLGSRLKGDVKQVQKLVAALSDSEIQNILSSGAIELMGHKILASELNVKYSFSGDKAAELSSRYEAHSDDSVLILLDTTPSQEMLDEGLAREIVNRVQKLRKKAKLVPTDEVTAWYDVEDKSSDIARIADSHREYIETATRTPFYPLSKKDSNQVVKEEVVDVKNVKLRLIITKGFCSTSSSVECCNTDPGSAPAVSWVNVIFKGTLRNGGKNCKATFLLENPVGTVIIMNFQELLEEASKLFLFSTKKIKIYCDMKVVAEKSPIKSYAGKTLVISADPQDISAGQAISYPYSRYVHLFICFLINLN